jgi:hypothetical protein
MREFTAGAQPGGLKSTPKQHTQSRQNANHCAQTHEQENQVLCFHAIQNLQRFNQSPVVLTTVVSTIAICGLSGE